MTIARVALPFTLSIASLLAQAQSDSVLINLSVSDRFTRRPLQGVSVINPRSGIGQPTDSKGSFIQSINRMDTFFLFYPGYQTVKFTLADSAIKSEYTLRFVLEPLSTGLSQAIVIKAPKTLEQIEAERKKLGTTPRELDKPNIDPFVSPIGALYELLSARSREREKLRAQMIEDDRRRIFRELLDYYNENQLIDLPVEYYDAFINYCNLPLDFLKYNTDYEITKQIVTAYNKYGRQHGIIK